MYNVYVYVFTAAVSVSCNIIYTHITLNVLNFYGNLHTYLSCEKCSIIVTCKELLGVARIYPCESHFTCEPTSV